MKCPKCNGRGNYYNGKTRLACPFCNGTGEVDNQPKGKLQSDGMPESIFPKPDRLYMKTFASYDGKYRSWIFDEKQNKDEYLRSDLAVEREKVRELVKAVDVLRNYAWNCMEGRKQEEKFVKLNCPVESLINSLFPDGLEEK